MAKEKQPRIEQAARPDLCPVCNAPSVARILYGQLVMSDELKKELAEGKSVDHGCLLSGDDPSWICTACGQPIHRAKQPRRGLNDGVYPDGYPPR